MPAIIKILNQSGLREVNYHADSLAAAAEFESRAGVYTVSNTVNRTQTLLFDAHLERLADSAWREGIPLQFDRQQLRSALRQMIIESGFGDVRFRISAPAAQPNELILSIEPYAPPTDKLIGPGVRCNTSSLLTRQNPAAKSSDWMHRRQGLESARPANLYETFLLDAEGAVLEGLGSNFYAVIDGYLRTAGSGVLAGISRRIVFAVCAGIVPMQEIAPNLRDLPRFDEAFMSSSSRGIIPVVEIDGRKIGAGEPGETTLRLREAYQHWVAAHLEEL
ncbi:MAG: aminotransferase class IV [Chloroflexi bacterium]|nr:aminotransferase class IV [Chloroflexota bacterium]